MKIISIIGLYFLSFSVAKATLEGDYILITGDKDCPSGRISLMTIDKERKLLFGSRLLWTLNLQDKSVYKEVVEKGCTYVTTYEKTLDTFKAETVRSNCPILSENAVTTEKLELIKFKLNYYFEQKLANNQKTKSKCTYKRSNK